MSEDAKPDAPPSLRTGFVLGRALTVAALLFCVTIYAGLLAHAPLAMQMVQAMLWILAWRNPCWPVYFLALALPFFGNQPGGAGGVYFIETTLAFILAHWLWGRLRAKAPPIVYTSLNPPLALFWLVGAVSIVAQLPGNPGLWDHFAWQATQNPGHAATWPVFQVFQANAFSVLWPLHAFSTLTFSLLFYLHLADRWRERAARERLLRALWAGALVSMVFGVLDFLDLLSLGWFRPENPDITVKFGYPRLQSFFGHSGWYAQYLAWLAPAALAFALFRGDGSRRRRRLRWTAGAVALSSPAVMLATHQRGGWLALAAGCGLVALLAALHWMRSGARRRATTLLAATALLAVLGGATLGALAWHGETPLGRRLRATFHLDDRTAIWSSAARLALAHPVAGVGFGRYVQAHAAAYPEGTPEWFLDKGTAHNTWLHVWVERGVFALLALAAAVVFAARRFALAWRAHVADPGRAPWIAAGAGLLAAWCVYSLVQHLFLIHVADLAFWTVLAASLHAADGVGPDRRPSASAVFAARGARKRRAVGEALAAAFLDVRGRLAPATLWFFAAPPAVLGLAACVIGPLWGGAVAALPAAESLGFGGLSYPYFVLGGLLAWMLATGPAALAARRPGLAPAQLNVASAVRVGAVALWLAAFLTAADLLLERSVRMGLAGFLALLFAALLTMNLGLLTARLVAAAAAARTLVGAPVSAVRVAAVFSVWFLATPVLYPYWLLPGWAQTLLLVNPALAPVRIAQRLLFEQGMPSAAMWFLLLAWNGVFAAATMGLAVRGRRTGKGGR